MSASRRALLSLSLVSMLVLSACGSGGGGSGSEGGGGGGGGGGTVAGGAVGFWAGETDLVDTASGSAYTLAGTVLDDGRYWFLLDLKGLIIGLIQGSGAASTSGSVTTFTTSTSSFQTRLDGPFVTKSTWSGTGTLPLQNGSSGTYRHAMRYDAAYDSPPAFNIAGAYAEAALPLAANSKPFSASISSSGAVSGTSSDGCTLNGQLTLRSGTQRIYNTTMTIAGGACSLTGGSSVAFTGIAEPTSNTTFPLRQRVLVKAVDNATQSIALVILIDR